MSVRPRCHRFSCVRRTESRGRLFTLAHSSIVGRETATGMNSMSPRRPRNHIGAACVLLCEDSRGRATSCQRTREDAMFGALAVVHDRLGEWWCRSKHSDVSWPMFGRYRCLKCSRTYQVPWGAAEVLPRDAGQTAEPVPSTKSSTSEVDRGESRRHAKAA